MRLRRALIGALAALVATVGFTAVAEPAFAAPTLCTALGYPSGRIAYDVDNANNGGGAYLTATVCWRARGNGYYNTFVTWDVTDTKANGAGATIRMEWTGTDGDMHYDVPPSSQRAWTEWTSAEGDWTRDNIKGLYVRACLTNTNSEAHHCGTRR
jgi:hypothetical protein